MQIMHHRLRFNLKRAHQVRQRFLEELKTSQIFEIPEVLALIDKPPTRQRKHILQVPAHCEQRRRIQ